MIIEKLELNLEAAKKYQIEAMILLMQKEQTLRSNVHSAIDEGLTLLGKGVVWGRKFSESFTAQTHRRADKLKKIEEAFDAGFFGEEKDDVEATETEPKSVKAEAASKPEPAAHKKQVKKANRSSVGKKTKMRDRRLRAHTNGAVRAH